MAALRDENRTKGLKDPLLGLQVGNYELYRRLGEGGYGVVYLARHLRLERPFVVKLLLPQYTDDPRKRDFFEREARSLARTQHPNVVSISDFGIVPRAGPYIVMEYIDGIELGEVIEHQPPLRLGRFYRICEQLCRGLQKIHEEGIVHRDLKPGNIMLFVTTGKEYLKIIDFGIAKIVNRIIPHLTDLTGEKQIGSCEYMSPEQITRDPLTPRADLYSLGVILYELLNRALPFEAPEDSPGSYERLIHIMGCHLTRPPEPFRQERLSPELQDNDPLESYINQRLLAKDPAHRPESALLAWQELEPLLLRRERLSQRS